jgi:arabinan endo-1,5-alpha-L-arabinosidase
MPAPAAQPGQRNHYRPISAWRSNQNGLIAGRSDEFNGSSLGSQWSWVREPAPSTYGVSGGRFRFDMQEADLHQDSNNASVLVQDAPSGEWLLEVRVRHTVPAEGCCPNFAQAGVVIYDNDDEYLKLVHASIWETRQTEWAKEVPANTPAPGYPRYGNTVVGPPGEWTTLRIVRIIEGDHEQYQAWTRRDGGSWVRGGTWEHDLEPGAKIGLVSMGEPGPDEYTAFFDWIRVYRLNIRNGVPIGEF